MASVAQEQEAAVKLVQLGPDNLTNEELDLAWSSSAIDNEQKGFIERTLHNREQDTDGGRVIAPTRPETPEQRAARLGRR